MDVVTIVGRKYVDFTDEKKGNQIQGWSLYYTMEDQYTEGVAAGKMFIPDSQVATMILPSVGKRYDVSYNRYGRPYKFDPVG